MKIQYVIIQCIRIPYIKIQLVKELILKTGLLLVLLYSQSATAATSADNLSRLLTPITSLSADFEQLILDNNGTRMQSSQGHVELMKPGFFKWKTVEPFPQEIVSNGKTLWLYDEDLEQVTQQPVDSRVSHTPALLFSGSADQIAENFSVTGPIAGDDGLYKLTPKDDEALYTVIRILFVSGTPAEMQLEDNLGQKTSLQFREISLNKPLSASDFEFDIPAGVDLIVE